MPGLVAVSNFSASDLGIWTGITAISYPYGYYTGASRCKPASEQACRCIAGSARHRRNLHVQGSAAGFRDNQPWSLRRLARQLASCWRIRTLQVLRLVHVISVVCAVSLDRTVQAAVTKPQSYRALQCAGRLMGFKPNDREADSTLAAKHD